MEIKQFNQLTFDQQDKLLNGKVQFSIKRDIVSDKKVIHVFGEMVDAESIVNAQLLNG